jgi:hypothetical protein
MNIDDAIRELSFHFEGDYVKATPELVVEYCKAKAIGEVGSKIVEAVNDLNTFHNTQYKLDEKLQHIGDQLGRLAEAMKNRD